MHFYGPGFIAALTQFCPRLIDRVLLPL